MSAETNPQVGMNETQRVNGVVRSLKRPKTFFLDKFFPVKQVEESTEVHIDIEIGHRKSAPYVAPRSKARAIRLSGFKTRTFTPPTTKLLADINPRAALRRSAGEPIGGNLTAQNRSAQQYVRTVAEIDSLVSRSQEHQAIESVVEGTVTVTGEGYDEPVVIDYGRDPSLSKALPGEARWNKSEAKPLEDLEAMGELVGKLEGAVVTDVIMDPYAWADMRKDPEVRELLKIRRATGGNQADIGPGNYVRGVKQVADLGDYIIWVYSDYKDVVSIDPETGVYTVTQGVPVLAPGTVIGCGPDMQGVRLFGALEDQRAIDMGLAATELFMNSWYDPESGVRYVQGQSAYLMVGTRPNAGYSLRTR